MVVYSRSRNGYKYAITALGLEQRRIRAKYEYENAMKHSYEHCVPTKWVESGYVEEVKDGEE